MDKYASRQDLNLAIAIGDAAEAFVEAFEEYIGENVALVMREATVRWADVVHVVEYVVNDGALSVTVAEGINRDHGQAVKEATTAGRRWIMDNVFPETAHALKMSGFAIESLTR